jgi:RimJ/RimL family protein N-acetyltransferase
VLREIEESDRASLSYWSDPEVTRYMPRGVVSEEGVRDLVERALEGRGSKPRRYFRLAVTLKESGRLVGDCVCRVTDQESREDLAKIIGQAYIGYFLNRESWGRGYATEVGRALLSFGFDQLKLLRIWAWCDTENSASVRVLEKLGMRQEAHFRKSVMVQGNWRDCFVYGMLRDEWDPSEEVQQNLLWK